MFKYTLCGLDNVWLKNGYTECETPYGRGVKFEDPEALDRAIGFAVAGKPGHLTGKEVRFFRQWLGLCQKDLGAQLGVDGQTVARWEKDQTEIGGAADKLLRLLFISHESGDTRLKEAVAKVNFIDRVANQRIVFSHNDHWEEQDQLAAV